MEDELINKLKQYSKNDTLLTATLQADDEDIIFRVLHVGQESVFVYIDGQGESVLEFSELDGSRLREYSHAAEFVQQEVVGSILSQWQARGKEFEMDSLDDVDIGWLLDKVSRGEVVGIKLEGCDD